MQDRDQLPPNLAGILRSLQPIYSDIRATCESLGIDIASAEQLRSLGEAVPLPWRSEPRALMRESQALMSEIDGKSISYNDVQEILQSEYGMKTWGLLNVLLCSENREWNPGAKNGFMSMMWDQHVGPLDCVGIDGDNTKVTECRHVAASWTVYNLLATVALEHQPISAQTKTLLRALVAEDVRVLATSYLRDIESGVLKIDHPLSHFEDMLFRIGARFPQAGSLVAEAQREFNAIASGADPDHRLFVHLLDEILPHEESIDLSDPLEQLMIRFKAGQAQRDAEKNLGLLTLFNELTEREEWTNPLGSVAQLARDQVIQLSIESGGVGDNYAKRREVIETVLSQMEAPASIIYVTSDLRLASAESSAVDSVVEGLQDYLKHGQRSFAELAVPRSIIEERLHPLLDELDMVSDRVGRENVHIIADADLEAWMSQRKISNGIVISASEHVSSTKLPRVEVRLTPVNAEPRYGVSLRNACEDQKSASIISAIPVLRGVLHYVVPELVATKGGEGILGLVGWRPDVAIELAKKGGMLAGIRSDAASIISRTVLHVGRIGPDNPEEEWTPVEEDDLELAPSGKRST